ncbi:hypothetical protein OIU76_020631 [Salix suchowensis]|uniref:Uncharacterized protein n=1 Tax=Salix suchowensis TaxID=1278906 RepID=A0ABQ8ZMR3_9ROSI|nr:hypothetical protein OIU76_020631 [Salix suchowensis]KAJ6303194.1 hypothetical protein OIU77_017139 [Salix suchowensis]
MRITCFDKVNAISDPPIPAATGKLEKLQTADHITIHFVEKHPLLRGTVFMPQMTGRDWHFQRRCGISSKAQELNLNLIPTAILQCLLKANLTAIAYMIGAGDNLARELQSVCQQHQ